MYDSQNVVNIDNRAWVSVDVDSREVVDAAVDMPEFTRRQLLLWAVLGMVIALIGGRYLWLAWTSEGDGGVVVAATVGLRQEEDKTIKVHVVGAVARPGLYDLEEGARAADAIGMAGGPAPSADLSRVNLAARVADGQQLVVPDISGATDGSGGTSAGGGRGQGATSGPVNLNSATIDELTSLDGIGPKTAQKIIDYREEHGGFSLVEELMEVPGIGPAKFDRVKDDVVV